jgi:hypothetical protein
MATLTHTVTINGKATSRTSKGHAYTHAVVVLTPDRGWGVWGWRSSRELADREANTVRRKCLGLTGIHAISRVEVVKVGSGIGIHGLTTLPPLLGHPGYGNQSSRNGLQSATTCPLNTPRATCKAT